MKLLLSKNKYIDSQKGRGFSDEEDEKNNKVLESQFNEDKTQFTAYKFSIQKLTLNKDKFINLPYFYIYIGYDIVELFLKPVIIKNLFTNEEGELKVVITSFFNNYENTINIKDIISNFQIVNNLNSFKYIGEDYEKIVSAHDLNSKDNIIIIHFILQDFFYKDLNTIKDYKDNINYIKTLQESPELAQNLDTETLDKITNIKDIFESNIKKLSNLNNLIIIKQSTKNIFIVNKFNLLPILYEELKKRNKNAIEKIRFDSNNINNTKFQQKFSNILQYINRLDIEELSVYDLPNIDYLIANRNIILKELAQKQLITCTNTFININQKNLYYTKLEFKNLPNIQVDKITYYKKTSSQCISSTIVQKNPKNKFYLGIRKDFFSRIQNEVIIFYNQRTNENISNIRACYTYYINTWRNLTSDEKSNPNIIAFNDSFNEFLNKYLISTEINKDFDFFIYCDTLYNLIKHLFHENIENFFIFVNTDENLNYKYDFIIFIIQVFYHYTIYFNKEDSPNKVFTINLFTELDSITTKLSNLDDIIE